MKKENKRKLKHYLIKKDLQLRLVINSLMYMFMIVIVTLGIVLYPLITDMVSSDNLEIQYRSAQIFIMLVERLLPSVLALFLLFSVHQIIVAHRICGPLVNFVNTFKNMSKGDLTRKVFIRRNDYLKVECEKINEMIEGISDILNQARKDQENLVSELRDLLEDIENTDTKEKLRSSIEAVMLKAKHVTDDLSRFTLEKDN